LSYKIQLLFSRSRRYLLQSSWVDPTKLFFFPNEEFFHFSLVSLHFRYIQKNCLIVKWPSLMPKKKKRRKKSLVGSTRSCLSCSIICSTNFFVWGDKEDTKLRSDNPIKKDSNSVITNSQGPTKVLVITVIYHNRDNLLSCHKEPKF